MPTRGFSPPAWFSALSLMHGLDAHATAQAAASTDEFFVTPGEPADHSMAGLCLAVLAAGLVLLAWIILISDGHPFLPPGGP